MPHKEARRLSILRVAPHLRRALVFRFQDGYNLDEEP